MRWTRGIGIVCGLAIGGVALAQPGGEVGSVDVAREERPLEDLRAREAEILEAVRQRSPERHAVLVDMRDVARTDPVARRRYMIALGRVARTLEGAGRQRAGRGGELEERLFSMAREYAESPVGRKESLRGEMETLAMEIFQLRQEERRAHLQQLEQRIERLREQIEETESRRDEIVKRRLDRLLEELSRDPPKEGTVTP